MEYTTKESLCSLSEQDPELTGFLKHHSVAHLRFEDLAKFIRAAAPPSADTETEFTREIQMRDGHQSQIRVFKPTASSSGPLVVLIHGGGYMIGDNSRMTAHAKALVALYGVVAVNLSYRLAPEHKFPTASNDIWDSLMWLSANAQSIGAEPEAGFIIGGISAGGNLAAVAAQKALNRLSHPITGVWLAVPQLLEREIVPNQYKDLFISREQNAASLILNADALNFMKDNYQPDIYSPDFSPFNAEDPHKGLPPVYIQVCGQDPLRDDGLIYEKALRENGVKTRLDVYPGVPHGHVLISGLGLSRKFHSDCIKGIAWLLGKDAPEEDIAPLLPDVSIPAPRS